MKWTTKEISDWVLNPLKVERDYKLRNILNIEFENIYFNKPISNGLLTHDIEIDYTNDEILDRINMSKEPNFIDEIISSGKFNDVKISNYKKLKGYQIEMLDDINRNRLSILNVSRQIGTSLVVTHHVLNYCLTNYHKRVVYNCLNLNNCDKFLNSILELMTMLPYHLQEKVIVKKPSSKEKILKLSFNNGTILEFITSDKMNLGGISIDYLIMPEFAFNSDTILRSYIPSMFARKDSRILIYSCPNEKSDIFETIFKGNNIYNKKTYTYNVLELPENIREDWVKDQISMIGEDSFLKEYECLFPGSQEFRDRKLEFILNNKKK